MYITPIIPSTNEIKLDKELLKKAEKLVILSGKLTGGFSSCFIYALKDLLRITNSYYSNMIESQSTHPIDIEKAMKKEFSKDEKSKKLQELSLVHIQVQKYLEKLPLLKNAYCKEIILDIYKQFYSKKQMKSFLDIKHENLSVKMVAGEIRKSDVKVGRHIPPSHYEIDSYFNEFQTLYNQSQTSTQTIKLIHALSSHHRLVYIHPFYDGNGRIARLFLDYLMYAMGLDGYGLWNISRGLARNKRAYLEKLELADEPYRGGYDDGRGNLSLKGLKSFVDFLLDISLDQVNYMQSMLKTDSLSLKMINFVKLSQENMLFGVQPLPKHSEKIFNALLIRGEIPRNDVKDIINMSKPTAIKIVKELEKRDFITSKEPKSPIRIKFNSIFASHIFPDLFPNVSEKNFE